MIELYRSLEDDMVNQYKFVAIPIKGYFTSEYIAKRPVSVLVPTKDQKEFLKIVEDFQKEYLARASAIPHLMCVFAKRVGNSDMHIVLEWIFNDYTLDDEFVVDPYGLRARFLEDYIGMLKNSAYLEDCG